MRHITPANWTGWTFFDDRSTIQRVQVSSTCLIAIRERQVIGQGVKLT